MTQESIQCLTPMPLNLRDFSPTGSDTCLDFGNDNSPFPSDYTGSPLSTPGNRKRKSQKKKDLGNLRETYQDMWIDEKRKYNVNRGLKYTSRNGKIKLEKQIKPPCPPTCKKKCTVHLTQSEREKIFNMFWKIGNHTRQWDFIAKYAKREKVNRTTKSDSMRTCTVKYFFPKKNEDTGDIAAIPVCKLMFLNTLAISYNFLKTALDKFYQGNGSIEPDRRGKHNNHPKTIQPDVIKSVCDHVNSLAPVESHLVRKRSDKLYLDGSLTYSKLFNLYIEWFDYTKYEEKALNVRQYRDIVNKNFKLSFHIPKKDKCDTCHIYENLEEPSVKEQSEQALHLDEKDRARDLKKSDKETATQNKEILTVVFDLQKTLSTPHGNISVFYYKRKLNVFNFSTFDMGSLEGRCYCWNEQIAKRGANEIASNVLHLIQSKIPDNIKEFRFWSDNCGGQNRNRIVFLMYMYACWKYNISIVHRFMVVGHTQNEGDSMHALIERKTKNINIYTPEQWYMAMRMAKTEKPYEVIEVSQDSIFDFKACLKLFSNWKKGTNKQTVMWSQMCEIFISHEEPFKINYKYTFEQEYESIECASIKQTRSRLSELEVGLNNITVAYQAPLPIDKQKLKDLNDLCKTGTIPAKYHEFYHKLV
ncbi:uncharacterized protein LOC133530002 [Cydia pomonella]|uniref:uncharacterized protein LOC133529996 n=1 Tax=Cydia pomonella TaxID=82600 RepID=UPI002ADE1E2B|nr:uncharacterized protein LOC133529996 [Cydia pomonella]XP_061723787.1 uncharacterized protein LOC133530002 [Cydia pomonella]